MTHPGAGFGQVGTTMRWTSNYFNGRQKLKRRDPFRSRLSRTRYTLCGAQRMTGLV